VIRRQAQLHRALAAPPQRPVKHAQTQRDHRCVQTEQPLLEEELPPQAASPPVIVLERPGMSQLAKQDGGKQAPAAETAGVVLGLALPSSATTSRPGSSSTMCEIAPGTRSMAAVSLG